MTAATKKALITAIMILAATLSAGKAAPVDRQEDEPREEAVAEGTPFHESLMPYALRWQRAILQRDYDALSEISPPYEKKEIKESMKDKQSPLYRGIYGKDDCPTQQPGKKTPYCILKEAKKPTILLIATKPVYKYGATAYYYDGNAVSDNPPTPPTDAVTCHFQWNGMKWYADFVDQYSYQQEEDPE